MGTGDVSTRVPECVPNIGTEPERYSGREVQLILVTTKRVTPTYTVDLRVYTSVLM